MAIEWYLMKDQNLGGVESDEFIEGAEGAFEDIANSALGEDVEIIDSFFENAPHDARPLWFLGKSLELLSTADVAVFCKGWENYRGCQIENTCCSKYDIMKKYFECGEIF